MPKWRPITPPILGSQIAQMQARIEQLERARTRGGGGGAGGVAGIGGPTGSQIQAGAAGPTNASGEVTITFNPAFSALPTIVAVAGGDGTDMLLCQVKTLSATQAVIVVTGIPVATAPVKTGIQDANHAHDLQGSTGFQDTNHIHNVPGQNTQSSGGHDHTIGTGATETHPGVTGSSGVHLHGISTIATDGQSADHRHPLSGLTTTGQSADHRHEITQVPKPTARQGVTVYWIATPRS